MNVECGTRNAEPDYSLNTIPSSSFRRWSEVREKFILKCFVVMTFAVLVAALWGSNVIGPRAHAQEVRRNTEAQKLKNPVALDSESIEAGKMLYRRFCASCHGPNGKGDGGLALSGGTPSDLTDETWDYGSTDGEIFVAIRDGVSADMLAYKDRLDEKQIWQVVNYLRSIGPKPKEDK
jgi:mono/diheme cytochrome c family protein